MSAAPEFHQLYWEGIRIEIRYVADYSSVYRATYGYALAQLELRSVDPAQVLLPVTDTGFRALITRADLIDSEGGPVDFTRAWLDHAALAPSWSAAQASRRQLSMF